MQVFGSVFKDLTDNVTKGLWVGLELPVAHPSLKVTEIQDES